MDIILAFHFILNNFYNNQRFTFIKQILADPDYLRIIKNSQERVWKDYFNAFQKNNIHNDYCIEKVFPLYTN